MHKVDPGVKTIVLIPHGHTLTKGEKNLLESYLVDELWDAEAEGKDQWILRLLHVVDLESRLLIDRQPPHEGWKSFLERITADLSGLVILGTTGPTGNICLTYTLAYTLTTLCCEVFKTVWYVSEDTFLTISSQRDQLTKLNLEELELAESLLKITKLSLKVS